MQPVEGSPREALPCRVGARLVQRQVQLISVVAGDVLAVPQHMGDRGVPRFHIVLLQEHRILLNVRQKPAH